MSFLEEIQGIENSEVMESLLWGFLDKNGYKIGNIQHENDIFVKNFLCSILDEIKSLFRKYDMIFREKYLPPPTSAQPFPDAKAVAIAKKIKNTINALEELEVSLRNSKTIHDSHLVTTRPSFEELKPLLKADVAIGCSIISLYQYLYKNSIQEQFEKSKYQENNDIFESLVKDIQEKLNNRNLL
jgi:hypothetical protein